MRLLHVSDNHGLFPDLPDGDFVVHSGDFLPNASRGNLNIEPKFQEQWVRSNIENFKSWLKDKPLLISYGNHDFIDFCPILNESGIETYNLNDKVTSFKGINFYGLPYIPYIDGEWNYERYLPDMNDEIRRMLERIKDSNLTIDILVAHSPPHGICDSYCGIHYGNTLLSNLLTYDQKSFSPKYILSGHIHQAHGFDELFGIKISNAATTVHIIDYQSDK